MQADPDEAGYVYVNGHVRTYHGNSQLLPTRGWRAGSAGLLKGLFRRE